MAPHRTGWRIEVKARPEGIQGFTPLAKLWVIERTNAWNGRYRRHSKDYEPMVLVSYIPDGYISILQTKFSYREGHEARRVGLEAMPLGQDGPAGAFEQKPTVLKLLLV